MNIKILDNFLEDNDFDELCKVVLKEIKSNQITVCVNKIKKDELLSAQCISKDFLKLLQKNYHEKAINILKEINPKKVDLYEYSEFGITDTGADYKFPIHDDTPNKLLSGVIYLSPEYNSGTIFYDNKSGDGKNEISWKQNRAVFFSRSERNTWHSFEGDKKSKRRVLVYNLMTTKIKEVCKIENKNYFLTQLRHIINPYLHRYFKFTI